MLLPNILIQCNSKCTTNIQKVYIVLYFISALSRRGTLPRWSVYLTVMCLIDAILISLDVVESMTTLNLVAMEPCERVMVSPLLLGSGGLSALVMDDFILLLLRSGHHIWLVDFRQIAFLIAQFWPSFTSTLLFDILFLPLVLN